MAASDLCRRAARMLHTSVYRAGGGNALILQWSQAPTTRRNWGDALNPVLAKWLSGKRVIHSRYISKRLDDTVHMAVGSILHTLHSPNTVVWGTGFIDSRHELKAVPREVRAVRGPLTRRKLVDMGVACPEVYGDPALLVPFLYRPAVKKKRQLGVILNHMERTPGIIGRFHGSGVHLIDMNAGIRRVVDEALSCSMIASSSLHGVILADAYGIPNVWLKLSDRPVGDDFKYRDYLASAGRPSEPLQPPDHCSGRALENCILDRFDYRQAAIDLRPMVRACPFMTERALDRIMAGLDASGNHLLLHT
ncbi:MAG: polysaccharide pyruvyl transferase family protein [Gammaproteobacteria bacterium]|nr:polysaccharide pyruvyl transferase family protein [Gammaproteobacteria bacterium]